MKKIFYYITLLSIAILPLSFTACGDDDDYKPGSEVSDNCPTVYFANTNDNVVYLTPEEAAANVNEYNSVDITVVREDSTGTLTVPVIVDVKSDGFDIPESVTFDDGDADTVLVVRYKDAGNGLSATFHLGEEYTNPYKKFDGTTTFNLSVSILEKVCNVTYDSTSRFRYVTNEIYNYKGQNKFMWTNFLGSGINVNFQVDPSSGVTFNASDIQSLKGGIKLLDHKLDYYNGGYWFILDDNGDWPSWTPTGQTEEISYFYMYDGDYSLIDFGDYNDGYYSGYFYFGFQVNGAWKVDGSGYLFFYFDYE